MTSVHIIGSGIAGLSCAYQLNQAGCDVSITSASNGPDDQCCSWWAGGMLAPACEQETAEPLIGTLGRESMQFWQQFAKTHGIRYRENGTLVVSQSRDSSLLDQFARNTFGGERLERAAIAELEPDLSHHADGLFFSDEAHLAPRELMQTLWDEVVKTCRQVTVNHRLNEDDLQSLASQHDWLLDCRGLAAASSLNDLRGVKGEMLHLYAPEVNLHRAIRLLHPRYPLYIVPRGDHQYMIGATMIEANQGQRVTVRSALELLSAAYTVQPGFAEAEIIEFGVDARPAFDDNLPKIRRFANTIHVNGLYRHGYLAAPALARRVADLILTNTICEEVVDANYPEWPTHQHAANHA